jgi:ADP-heptose:LPS heptosyltransferase
VRALTRTGRQVLVTGSAAEAQLTARVAAAAVGPGTAHDYGGQLSLVELAAVLRRAAALAVANTGPAHLAAAVGTPVVSLFAPVVPAARWAPYGEHVLLGDQTAPCAGSRARECPVPGHPCLASVPPSRVVDALESYLAMDGSSVERAAVSV